MTVRKEDECRKLTLISIRRDRTSPEHILRVWGVSSGTLHHNLLYRFNGVDIVLSLFLS